MLTQNLKTELTDVQIFKAMSAMAIRGGGRKIGTITVNGDSRCSTEAHRTEYPLLIGAGVCTTVNQDQDLWNADSNDSGIGDELDLLRSSSIGPSANNSLKKKFMVPLPSKIAPKPTATTKAAQTPAPATRAANSTSTMRNGNVLVILLTASGPSLAQVSPASDFQIDSLLSGLLRRTQGAGMKVRQLPIFFESQCNTQQRHGPPSQHTRTRTQQSLLNSPSDILPNIFTGSEYFRTTRCLGKGNFGQVYMCHVDRLNVDNSLSPANSRALKAMQQLKTYRAELSVHSALQRGHTEESYRRTFLLWMAANVRIIHRGHEIGCLLLELAPGGSLQDLQVQLHAASVPMQERQAAFYLAETACALDYLHSRGYLHLDFKADNVLLTASGHARLADFGHSLQLDGSGRRALSHLTAGLNTFHLPPELMRCSPVDQAGCQTGKVVTKATDWFSYGCLAFWLLHNFYPIVPPKGLRSAAEFADYMASAGYRRLAKCFQQQVSPAYRHLVSQLLQPSPSLRPCGLAQLLSRHRDVFADCGLPAWLTPSEARGLIEDSSLMPPFVPLPSL